MVVNNTMRQILSSVDIGSSKIKIVVGETKEDGGMNILCALDEVSRGVKNGVIVEVDETVYAIKKLLKRAEDMLGIKITKTLVGINEESASFKIGEASVTITQEDREILVSDIVRVLQTSVKGNIKNDYELVTVIPIKFKVDDKLTRNPRGLRGESLSVKSVVVSVPKKDIFSVAKCLEKCGLEVVDICLSSIGSYYAHKTETTDTVTGVVIDLGHDTTKIAIFNTGIIVNNLVMGIGGKNVDSDISFIYKIDEENSSRLKENLAHAHKKSASPREKETVINSLGEKVTINQFELSEVVMSRVSEMLNMAKNEINYLTKKEISYIIITGGLSEIKNFSLVVESVFGRSAQLGKINIIGARSNEYASCIGMIKFFDSKLKLRDREFSVISSDDEEVLCGTNDKKNSGDSILGKVFGMFFDN